jgi:ankyrin repeat protein
LEDAPLVEAAKSGKLDMVKLLLANGADIEQKCNDGQTAMHWASMKGYHPIVKALIGAKGSVTAEDIAQYTPLHYAKSRETAMTLINGGANVEALNDWKQTPLHTAASMGNHTVVRYLLAKVKDINAADKDGMTALMIAAKNNKAECVRALLDDERINVAMKNTWEQTAIDVSATEEIKNLIRSAGK